MNFGNHPDTAGGWKISADWPGFTRKTVEKVLDNTRCIFFNGAQGDVNHGNVHPRGGCEAGPSNYKAGVAEILIKEDLDMLKYLK